MHSWTLLQRDFPAVHISSPVHRIAELLRLHLTENCLDDKKSRTKHKTHQLMPSSPQASETAQLELQIVLDDDDSQSMQPDGSALWLINAALHNSKPQQAQNVSSPPLLYVYYTYKVRPNF